MKRQSMLLAIALLGLLSAVPAGAGVAYCNVNGAELSAIECERLFRPATDDSLQVAAKPEQKCPGLSDRELNQRADAVVKYVQEAINDGLNRKPVVTLPANRNLLGPLEREQVRKRIVDIAESACR